MRYVSIEQTIQFSICKISDMSCVPPFWTHLEYTPSIKIQCFIFPIKIHSHYLSSGDYKNIDQ